MKPLGAFAAAPPGMGELVAAELTALGIDAPRIERGGVSFSGAWRDVYAANLGSRVAGRILVRIAAFETRTYGQLAHELKRIDWRPWYVSGAPLTVHATVKKSRLFHTGKLADLLHDAAKTRPPEEGEQEEAAAVYLRIAGDRATVSFDSTGAHLHKRGYREWTGAAPLRENLAAGLLLRAGFRPGMTVLDPCAGSGTFPVEAALMNAGLPPGGQRSFAFQRMPGYDGPLWAQLLESARAQQTPPGAFAYGSDVDEDALRLAARAARQARVAERVKLAAWDVRELEPPEPAGLLVANPPYGKRVPGAKTVCDALGRLLCASFSGWRWGIVVASESAGRALALRPKRIYNFTHGGLSLAFWTGGPEADEPKTR